jgi:hypothetical protein
MSEEEKILVPRDLASRLESWHSSMGDPIYAVSSCGSANHPVPRETFERALANIKLCAMNPDRTENLEELKELTAHMQSVLGDADSETAVTRGFARTLWALAWASESEEQSESDPSAHYPGGCQLLTIAPDTPQSVYTYCAERVRLLKQENKISISDLLERYKNEFNTPYDFGHELAMAMTGHGGEIDFDDYKLPYCETFYYEFADKFIRWDA